MGGGFLERFGKSRCPGSEVVGLELDGVLAVERTLHDEDKGDVIGSEGLEGLGEFEKSVIEHELDAGRNLVGFFFFEVSRRPRRDGGVEDEEAAELDGGVFKVLGGPGLLKSFGAVGLELGEDACGGRFLKSGEEFGRDFACDESGSKLLDG